MPLKNKKSKWRKSTWRKAIWIAMTVFIVLFVIFALIFRQSLKQISKDPSLTSLTNESVFRIMQIINLNEKSDQPQKFEEGYYELKGTRDYKWLEKSEAKTKLSDDFVRDTLAGFMLENRDYYQTIEIKYPTPDEMQISVTTENNNGDTSNQLIKLNAK